MMNTAKRDEKNRIILSHSKLMRIGRANTDSFSAGPSAPKVKVSCSILLFVCADVMMAVVDLSLFRFHHAHLHGAKLPLIFGKKT